MTELNAGYRRIAERIFRRGIKEAELLGLACYKPGCNWAAFYKAVDDAYYVPRLGENPQPQIVEAIRDIVIPKPQNPCRR